MSYIRVIPRDLFNEAKLLKCLGRLYIEAEHQPEGKVEVAFAYEHSHSRFDIQQEPSDGSIYVSNVHVTVNSKRVHVYTGLNARSDWPMYASLNDETVAVFDDNGHLTPEFLALGSPT